MLPLSGIQHYVFCPRQWALIHLEQQWSDNRLTAEGNIFHKNVDNPFYRQTNGTPTITLRGVDLVSETLGLSGRADAVELHPMTNAPAKTRQLLESRQFSAIPIEYKHGKRKFSDCDRLQVAAQAMILEGILGIGINQGAVYYLQERHREYFEITEKLRRNVEDITATMHKLFQLGKTPSAEVKPHCRSCSLLDICVPTINGKCATKYIHRVIDTLSD